MSKLPKAPLIEVVFELRWTILTKEELNQCQYLHGDFYSKIKNQYNFREALITPEIPLEICIGRPTHRFRQSQDGYPLVQVGPGILTLNTVDSKYFWEEFELLILEAINKFNEVFVFPHGKQVTLSLQYFDFIKFDFTEANIFEYLEENLNINLGQKIYQKKDKPVNLNLGMHFDTEEGALSVVLSKGLNNLKENGIIIQTSLLSTTLLPNIESIKDWISKSHDVCSQVFKDMTKGKLYDSFK